MQERSARVPFTRPVHVVPLGGERGHRLLAANLSQSGMFLRAGSPLRPGTVVALSLEAKGQVFPFAKGEVIWSTPSQVPAGRLPGFGVRFTEFLHPRSSDLVEHLLARQAPLVPPNPPLPEPTTSAKPAAPEHAGATALPSPGWQMSSPDWTVVTDEDLPQAPPASAKDLPELEVTELPPPIEGGPSSTPAWAMPELGVPLPTVAPPEDLDRVAGTPQGQGASVKAVWTAVAVVAIAVALTLAWAVRSTREETHASAEPQTVLELEPPAAAPAQAASAPAAPAQAAPAAPSQPAPSQAAPAHTESAQAAPNVAAPGAAPTEPTVEATHPSAPPAAPAQLEAAPEKAKPESKPKEVAAKEAMPAALVPAAPAAKPHVASAPKPPPPAKPVTGATTHRTMSLSTGAAKSLELAASAHAMDVNLKLAPGAHLAKVFSLASPARLVLDVDGPSPSGSKTIAAEGPRVKSVRIGARPGGTRVVLDLAEAPAHADRAGDGARLTFR